MGQTATIFANLNTERNPNAGEEEVRLLAGVMSAPNSRAGLVRVYSPSRRVSYYIERKNLSRTLVGRPGRWPFR